MTLHPLTLCLLLPPKFKKYVCYLRSSISFLFIVKCRAWMFIFLTHFKLFHLIEIRNKCPSHSSHYSTFSFPHPLVMGLFFTFWIFCIGIYIGWLKKQNNQKKHVSQVRSCYSPKNEWRTEPFGEGNVLGHWLDLEGTCPRGQEAQTLSLPFTCSSNSCHCSACCFPRISDAFSFWAHASSITEIFCSSRCCSFLVTPFLPGDVLLRAGCRLSQSWHEAGPGPPVAGPDCLSPRLAPPFSWPTSCFLSWLLPFAGASPYPPVALVRCVVRAEF